MKKHFVLMLIPILLMGCNAGVSNIETNPVTMEDLSVQFSGIEFTKGVNDIGKYYRVEDSVLIVDGITGTNYFISPDAIRSEATAPILLTEIDNRKPFTFTTRMQSNIEKIYDAGTVYIFVDNQNWLKLAFERDEKLRRRVVTVRTVNSSDDNNHDIIEQDYVYVRISSNGKQIGYYYSLDGLSWNLARIYRNESSEDISGNQFTVAQRRK